MRKVHCPVWSELLPVSCGGFFSLSSTRVKVGSLKFFVDGFINLGNLIFVDDLFCLMASWSDDVNVLLKCPCSLFDSLQHRSKFSLWVCNVHILRSLFVSWTHPLKASIPPHSPPTPHSALHSAPPTSCPPPPFPLPTHTPSPTLWNDLRD